MKSLTISPWLSRSIKTYHLVLSCLRPSLGQIHTTKSYHISITVPTTTHWKISLPSTYVRLVVSTSPLVRPSSNPTPAGKCNHWYQYWTKAIKTRNEKKRNTASKRHHGSRYLKYGSSLTNCGTTRSLISS